MNLSQFEKLPYENILEIAKLLSLESIDQLCRTSTRFRDLCNEEDFWHDLFIAAYGYIEDADKYNISWRYLFYNYFNVWGYGDNSAGQLGLGNEKYIKSFKLLKKFKAQQVSCGYGHTAFLNLHNNIYVTGYNRGYRLGLKSGEVRTPTQLAEFKAKQVACGSSHTAFIDLAGNIYITDKDEILKRIEGYKAQYIACGAGYTAFIELNNDIYTFGNNRFGQLGLGHNERIPIPSRIEGHKAQYISCGSGHAAFIDLQGKIFTFGSNLYSQLGLGHRNKVNRPTEIEGFTAKYISCGLYHTGFITEDGTVYMFGRNGNKQLGLNDRQIRNIPTVMDRFKAKQIACGENCTAFIDTDNNLWMCGRHAFANYPYDLIKMDNFKVHQVAAALDSFIAIGYDISGYKA